jgi:hypothetical protein
MDNILLNTWIELENGLKARLTRAAGGSKEKYILILEAVENENARKINLIVSGRKVFDCSGKRLDFGDAYPMVTEYGKMMMTKKFISAWLE